MALKSKIPLPWTGQPASPLSPDKEGTARGAGVTTADLPDPGALNSPKAESLSPTCHTLIPAWITAPPPVPPPLPYWGLGTLSTITKKQWLDLGCLLLTGTVPGMLHTWY